MQRLLSHGLSVSPVFNYAGFQLSSRFNAPMAHELCTVSSRNPIVANDKVGNPLPKVGENRNARVQNPPLSAGIVRLSKDFSRPRSGPYAQRLRRPHSPPTYPSLP